MRYLHLMSTDKFTEPFVEFINNNFDISSHKFLCFNSAAKNHVKKNHSNLFFHQKIFLNWEFLKNMYKAEAIYLHALFDTRIIIFLFFQPWLLKKCYWVVWGGDLYIYMRRKETIKLRIQELFRKFVIKRFAGLITHIKGDYNLAKKWYNVRGDYFYSFLYPSNLWKEIEVYSEYEKKSEVLILVGNSADPSNNHIEVFKSLKKIIGTRQVKVIVPLSYGDEKYIEYIAVKGEEYFGEKFEPIFNFLSVEQYTELLAGIDIAVFNHNRQQALGNISTLISLKKKVYIRDDITTWKFCIDHDLKVFSTNNDLNNIFNFMSSKDKNMNYMNMKNQFSKEKLVEHWYEIFEKV